MLTQLTDHEEIVKFKDNGYSLEIILDHVVIFGIPYLNENLEIKFGEIYCKLELSGSNLLPPRDHTAWFTGSQPYNIDGSKNNSFINAEQNHMLNEQISGKFYLSSKPDEGHYKDYYTKLKRYIVLISAPAFAVDPSISYKNFDYKFYNANSVFNIPDSHSPRMGISHLNKVFDGLSIAIIGLGGTGGYILDFVSKTNVSEITLYDGDVLKNHNTYRIPGSISIEEVNNNISKAEYFCKKYLQFRKNIKANSFFVDETNVNELSCYDFIFISIDDSKAKKIIVDYCVENNKPFVDSGIGLSLVDNSIRGTIRSTMVNSANKEYLKSIDIVSDNEDNVYKDNIQISEINALNAVLSVIMWKKYLGYYSVDDVPYKSIFILDEGDISNES